MKERRRRELACPEKLFRPYSGEQPVLSDLVSIELVP
jgi:hypothetical protein